MYWLCRGMLPKSLRWEGSKMAKSKVETAAVAFFLREAGYSCSPGESEAVARTRGARSLAYAEAEAQRRGWTVRWEDDPDGWESLRSDVRQGYISESDAKEVVEILSAVLRDSDGEVLASVGNVQFSRGPLAQRYGRVVEAELAQEALGLRTFN